MGPERSAPLRVFVYGTLRKGGEFHDRFCRGVVRIEEGSVSGRVSRLAAGYPVLDVPAADVLARGSNDALADTERLAEVVLCDLDRDERSAQVAGEVLFFDDPLRRLSALDRLEGFRPDEPSLYDRVVLSVRLRGGRRLSAWAYVRGPLAR